MGTRFMTTKESPLHENFKRLSMEKDAQDTLYSSRFDGIPCRVLKTAHAERFMQRRLNLLRAFFNARAIARQLRLPFVKLFFGVIASGWNNAVQLAYMANGFEAFRVATEEGNTEEGLLPVGQATGLIHDEPTVAELLERIVSEARAVQRKFQPSP
jgi:enoyl-[acyl-carrier protein] reductase II